MEIEDEVLASLVRELGLPEELIVRWFQTGQALAGAAPAPPEPVQAVEAIGPEGEALYTRGAQFQTLWRVVAGVRAEYEEAVVAGDNQAKAELLHALTILMALAEEERESLSAAVKARSN